MEPRLWKIVSFFILGTVLILSAYFAYTLHQDTYDEVKVKYHSIKSHSLGIHQQSDQVRARIIIDEGSVAVMEGRVAIVQLLDSDNRASMEQGKGYIPLAEVRIDVKETSFPMNMRNEGYIEYTAHRTDTYYLVYRNEDWWNLTMRVADGEAIEEQLYLKLYATTLVIATIIIFAWAYGRIFQVDVRQKLGLIGRPKGPGARAAQEPEAPLPAAEDMVLEAEE